MANIGLKGLLLLLAVVLFVVGALMDPGDNKVDILYWGLAVVAAALVIEALPLGNLGSRRNRT